VVYQMHAGMNESPLQSALDADQHGLVAATVSSVNPLSATIADLLPGFAGLTVSQDLSAGVGRQVVAIGSRASVGGGLQTQSSVPAEHSVAGLSGRTQSRNSYSPMSDSGISVDAASTGSVAAAGSQAFNAALSKLILPLSASSQGQCCISVLCIFPTCFYLYINTLMA